MTSLERILTVTLAGALFLSLLNLAALVIVSPLVFPAVFLMAILAMILATAVILPIVAGIEVVGRLFLARRNTRTLILAIGFAACLAWLIPRMPFEEEFRSMPWIRVIGGLGTAWLWWHFLPLPERSITPNAESNYDA